MREQYLAAVHTWLERVERERDPHLTLTPSAVADAERLAGLLEGEIDVEVCYVLGWFHWYRSCALPDGQVAEELEAASQCHSVCLAAGVEVGLPEPLLPFIAEQAAGIALQWTQQHLESSPDVETLTATITLWQRIIGLLSSDHPDRVVALAYLAINQYMRYRWTSELDDLDQAIKAGRPLLDSPSSADPELVGLASNVGAMLLTRFERKGDPADLDEAITICQQVVDAVPADDPQRPVMLSNLSNALRIRFNESDNRADIDAAIEYARAAVAGPAEHPDRAGHLSTLGAALRVRFERADNRSDIDEAVAATDEAVATIPNDHLGRTVVLHNLGSVRLIRYERLGEPPDLTRAIEISRVAVAACPAGHPERGAILSHLGAGLRYRFTRWGDPADLDEAIAAHRAAVEATPTGHPARHKRLMNLSGALRFRFERIGVGADLDQSLTWARKAINGAPADHPDRAHMLHNVASILHMRFERTTAPPDLDEAVVTARHAIAATPDDHPSRAERLTVLANVLHTRFHLATFRADLDEAIAAGREAARIAPAGSPLWATCESNFALVLRTKATLTRDRADLDRVIAAQRAVLAATSTDTPSYAERLLNLGHSLLMRNTETDVAEATTIFLRAVDQPSIAPSVRIDASAWAATVLVDRDARRAGALLESAVGLLPEMASHRLARDDQQHVLAKVAGLASHAAALALADESGSAEDPAARALRLLELGRGIILNQALDSRSDLTDLRARHPGIAARFVDLRDLLDTVTSDPIADRQQTAAEFSALLSDIRGLDGFASFLLPPEPAALVRHAEAGPIVVLNVSKYRSDAIVLTTQGITALPLPSLTFDLARERIVTFHQALRDAHNPEAEPDHRIGAQDILDEVLGWLWDTAIGPVLDQLGYRSTPGPGTKWPRVWWIPVGWLALLPIHAAGHHRQPAGPAGRPTAMDRVISSYTPTVRALGYARERDTSVPATAPALVVAMPTTPGVDNPLSHATREAELVHTRLPGSTLLIDDPAVTIEQIPTKAAVLSHLADSAIAHFACHGDSHTYDPSRSMLMLHDHNTDPLTVANMVPIRLAHARLAYLSACRTAFNPASDLADEAIHLTTAFQLAGYPHVVGTLWEIDDPLAVTVADSFYTTMVTSHTIDTTLAAEALHHAVRAVRDILPKTPSLWAAYIHTGA